MLGNCCWPEPEPEPVAEAMASPTPLTGVVGNGTERDGGSRGFLVLLNYLKSSITSSDFQSSTPKRVAVPLGACIFPPQHYRVIRKFATNIFDMRK